jgi:hypothetical protein
MWLVVGGASALAIRLAMDWNVSLRLPIACTKHEHAAVVSRPTRPGHDSAATDPSHEHLDRTRLSCVLAQPGDKAARSRFGQVAKCLATLQLCECNFPHRNIVFVVVGGAEPNPDSCYKLSMWINSSIKYISHE